MTQPCDHIQERLVDQGPSAFRDDESARAHLVECSECFGFLEALGELDDRLSDLRAIDAPDAVVAKTLQAVGASAGIPVEEPPPMTAAVVAPSQPMASAGPKRSPSVGSLRIAAHSFRLRSFWAFRASRRRSSSRAWPFAILWLSNLMSISTSGLGYRITDRSTPGGEVAGVDSL